MSSAKRGKKSSQSRTQSGARSRSADPGQVRLIAGQWRGRKLPVPDLPGLRPSGDRSRETLFNWLQPFVPGSRCADLFAGSGALGFEAASRGAVEVHLIEIAPLAISAMLESKSLLQADQVEVHRSNALDWIQQQAPDSFDLLFVDPPFDSGLAIQTLNAIVQSRCVAPGGMIYVEAAAQLPELVMQAPFALWREKVMGDVRMRIFRKEAPG